AGPVQVSGGTATVNAPVSVPTLSLVGGTLTGAANLTVTGAMTWTGGTQAGAGATVLGAGASLNIPNGFPGSGGRAIDATAAGAAVSWAAGTLSGAPSSTAFSLSGPLNLSGAAAKVLSGVTVNKSGPTTWAGTGQFRLDSGAAFNNQAGAVFDAQSD